MKLSFVELDVDKSTVSVYDGPTALSSMLLISSNDHNEYITRQRYMLVIFSSTENAYNHTGFMATYDIITRRSQFLHTWFTTHSARVGDEKDRSLQASCLSSYAQTSRYLIHTMSFSFLVWQLIQIL